MKLNSIQFCWCIIDHFALKVVILEFVGQSKILVMKYRMVNILLALGCKTTVDALAYYAGVAAEIDLKLKLEQVFDR